jgi:hypothetical protein
MCDEQVAPTAIARTSTQIPHKHRRSNEQTNKRTDEQTNERTNERTKEGEARTIGSTSEQNGCTLLMTTASPPLLHPTYSCSGAESRISSIFSRNGGTGGSLGGGAGMDDAADANAAANDAEAAAAGEPAAERAAAGDDSHTPPWPSAADAEGPCPAPPAA